MDAEVQVAAGSACASAPTPVVVAVRAETPLHSGGYVPRPRAIYIHRACVFHLPCPPPVKV